MKRKGKFQKKSPKKPIGILFISVALVAAISCGIIVFLNQDDGATSIAPNERTEAQLPVSAELLNPTVNSQSVQSDLAELFVPLNIPFHGTYVSKATSKRTDSGISRINESTLRWEDDSDNKEIMRKHIDLGDGYSCEITVYLGSPGYDHTVIISSEYFKNDTRIMTRNLPAFSISTRNQCYIILKNDYLAIIDKSEKTEGWYDGY